MVKTKYTPQEIEVFKLVSRVKKLDRQLERAVIQGNLFPDMSEEEKRSLRYDIARLKNRLQAALNRLPNE